jgi:hypothetical protein
MNRATLRQVLTTHFTKDELRNLYFDLGVDYEALPDQGKDAKVRELIAHFEHRGCITELVVRIKQVRPNAFESVPSDERLESRRDTLQQKWDLLNEKINRLHKAHVVEAGVTVEFQLEQEIKKAEAIQAQIGDELDQIEHSLQ